MPQGRCHHAIGLDLSAGMLRSLEDLRQSGGLSLVQADAQRLPLPDRSVDVAMAMHMLYHVPDVPAAIRELRRITKRDGTVLASTTAPPTWPRSMTCWSRRSPAGLTARSGRCLLTASPRRPVRPY